MSRNFLIVLGGLILLTGFWGMLTVYSSVFAFGLPEVSWWQSLLKILVGGAAILVAYNDK